MKETLASDLTAEVERLREQVLDLGEAVTRLTAEVASLRKAVRKRQPDTREAQRSRAMAEILRRAPQVADAGALVNGTRPSGAGHLQVLPCGVR